MWRKNTLNLIQSFKGVGFVGLKAQSKDKGVSLNFVNIYAPCNSLGRKEMWLQLINLKRNVVGEEWCIGGDYNSVLYKEERIGKYGGHLGKDCEAFQRFVEEMDIIDLPSVGGRYTWFSGYGNAMSRFDRFLVSDSLISRWNLENRMVGKRINSNHCPVWLKSVNGDWGPKPFRFNNGWFKHEEFRSFVAEEWNLISVVRRGDFVLYEKLKKLKPALKKWNKEIFGWIDLKIEEKIDEQHDLDIFLLANIGKDVAEIAESRRKVADDLWRKMEMKECMLRVKSGQKWLKEGDFNTKCFHSTLKERIRRNSFSLLDTAEGRIQGPVDVKSYIRNHFLNFFKESSAARPVPAGIVFSRLKDEDVVRMERPFEEA
ncbi:uncharacterized protein LOC131648760 [Vicia villosa]|uniref:uncharacterized protein LOC131648760 n=1 Tax=Vicia villosa TaxID=3911 RepID=UPI00273CCDAE|nr:uncharacterized protein LOC131648760 [Vicia villosa]